MAIPSNIIPIQDLPILPISEQSYIVTADTAKDIAGLVYMPEITAAAAAIESQITPLLDQAKLQIDLSVYNAEKEALAVLAGIGYIPPVEYQAGINVSDSRITVSYNGGIYAPASGSVPFITTEDFDQNKWRVIQGITFSDLNSPSGSSLVGFDVGGGKKSLSSRLSSYIFLSDFDGIDPSGVSDSTEAIQRAFNVASASGSSIYVPKGRYSITSRQISLNSNLNVNCHPDAVFVISESLDQTNFAFSGNYVSNISFKGGRFSSQNSRSVAFSFTGASKNIKIESVICENSRVAVFGAGLPYSDAIIGTNTCSNVSVNYCTASCDSVIQENSYGAIDFRYCVGFSASGNNVDGYRHGINWWGGNANSNGAINNERKCISGIISLNIVKNTIGGGIWGAMGRNIVVSSNIVDTSEDVGIDFEGCYDCQAVGNFVKNCRYGALSNFFITKNLLFSSNTVVSTIYNNIMYKTEFSGTVGENSDVTVSDNKFFNYDNSNFGYAVRSNGPINSFVFKDNYLYNCTIGYEGVVSNNSLYNNLEISGNKILIERLGQAQNSPTLINARYFYALGTNTVRAKIVNNELRTLNASGMGSIGIQLVQDQSSYTFIADINENFIDLVGTGNEIAIIDTGTNSGITSVFNLDSNVLRYGRILRNENGSTKVRFNIGLSNISRANDGRVWPGSIPTLTNHPTVNSIKWDEDQIIRLTGRPGGYMYAVCTVPGVDGTAVFKRFGQIES